MIVVAQPNRHERRQQTGLKSQLRQARAELARLRAENRLLRSDNKTLSEGLDAANEALADILALIEHQGGTPCK